jgi:hypothetical protein
VTIAKRGKGSSELRKQKKVNNRTEMMDLHILNYQAFATQTAEVLNAAAQEVTLVKSIALSLTKD